MPEREQRFARLFDDREADEALLALLEDADAPAGHPAGSGPGGSPGPGSGTATTLAQRLRAAPGPLSVVVRGVGSVRGRVAEAGVDAVVVAAPDGSEWVLPYRAVMWVDGLAAAPVGAGAPGAVAPTAGVPAGLTGLLRRWVRDGVPVTLHLIDGGTLSGTPAAAGADHLDLAEHGPDEPRRTSAGRRVIAVPYASVGALRRR